MMNVNSLVHTGIFILKKKEKRKSNKKINDPFVDC